MTTVRASVRLQAHSDEVYKEEDPQPVTKKANAKATAQAAAKAAAAKMVRPKRPPKKSIDEIMDEANAKCVAQGLPPMYVRSTVSIQPLSKEEDAAYDARQKAAKEAKKAAKGQ